MYTYTEKIQNIIQSISVTITSRTFFRENNLTSFFSSNANFMKIRKFQEDLQQPHKDSFKVVVKEFLNHSPPSRNQLNE